MAWGVPFEDRIFCPVLGMDGRPCCYPHPRGTHELFDLPTKVGNVGLL